MSAQGDSIPAPTASLDGSSGASVKGARIEGRRQARRNAKRPPESAPIEDPASETASKGSTGGRSRGRKGDSLLRYDVRPEDVLDQEVLDKIDRKHAASEAEFQRRLDNGTLEEGLLTVDDLRELAERASRGEQVTLKKT